MREQAEAKLAEVQGLLDSEDPLTQEQQVSVKSLQDEVDGMLQMIEAGQRQEALKASAAAPAVTPPHDSGEPDPAPLTPEGSNVEQQLLANQAAHAMQYNEQPAAIKQILTELHGVSYLDQAWRQTAAFNVYLRHGAEGLDRSQRTLLKDVVLTPSAVDAAIKQGVDDISALKSTMVEAQDTLGGFIVPVDFQNRVIQRLMGLVAMRGRATVLNTSSNRLEIPVATGGDSQYTSAARVTWVEETPTAGTSETNLTFGLEGIPIHTVMAEVPLSRNLVEDAAFNLAQYLARQLAEAVAIDEDNQFINGDGVGKPQGILVGGANTLSLSTASTGDANDLTFDGIIDLAYTIDSQYRQNATWLMERLTARDIRKLKDAEGNYLWPVYADNISGQPRGLLGSQVVEQEVMPTVAAGVFPIIYGDLSGYTIADRVGMSIERYLDSQTARQNLVYYVMRRRCGGQVTEPWRFAIQEVTA
jgi:HK97 family phage major capsid protein